MKHAPLAAPARALLALGVALAFLPGCRASGEASETVRAQDAPPPEAGPVPESGAGSHRAITTEQLEPYSCGTISRLHTLGGIFLASQPAPADFEQAKEGGVVTVLDLRHDRERPDFDERAFVTELGLQYVQLPWNGPDELTDEVFDEGRRLLSTLERPLLFHCGSANRVGALWIPWRVLDGGLDLEEAVAEAKVIGLKTPAYEARAREYVASHR